jgi:hypothetical protein
MDIDNIMMKSRLAPKANAHGNGISNKNIQSMYSYLGGWII